MARKNWSIFSKRNIVWRIIDPDWYWSHYSHRVHIHHCNYKYHNDDEYDNDCDPCIGDDEYYYYSIVSNRSKRDNRISVPRIKSRHRKPKCHIALIRERSTKSLSRIRKATHRSKGGAKRQRSLSKKLLFLAKC